MCGDLIHQGGVDGGFWPLPLGLLGVNVDVEVLVVLGAPDCFPAFGDLGRWRDLRTLC